MRILLTVTTSLFLIPCTSFADTNCRLVEYNDHFVAECTGDKTAVTDVGVPQNMPYQVPNGAAKPVAGQGRSTVAGQLNQPLVVASSSSPAQSASAAAPKLLHRQGRQQFQEALQEARAERGRITAGQ